MATCEANEIHQSIVNNQPSFHLCWKGNLLNLQKVSKCYEHDCRSATVLCSPVIQNSYVSPVTFLDAMNHTPPCLIMYVLLC